MSCRGETSRAAEKRRVSTGRLRMKRSLAQKGSASEEGDETPLLHVTAAKLADSTEVC